MAITYLQRRTCKTSMWKTRLMIVGISGGKALDRFRTGAGDDLVAFRCVDIADLWGQPHIRRRTLSKQLCRTLCRGLIGPLYVTSRLDHGSNLFAAGWTARSCQHGCQMCVGGMVHFTVQSGRTRYHPANILLHPRGSTVDRMCINEDK